MARQMHRHDQLRGYGGGDYRQGHWIVEVAHRPSTHDNPLMEWKLCEDKNVYPLLGRLARRVLAVPATLASPESLFSTAGNQSSQEVEGGLVVSLNLSSVSFIQPSLLPLPLLITLPLSPSLAQGQTLTVSIRESQATLWDLCCSSPDPGGNGRTTLNSSSHEALPHPLMVWSPDPVRRIH
jgi:hypothetical protein